jgi:hypothetical protein
LTAVLFKALIFSNISLKLSDRKGLFREDNRGFRHIRMQCDNKLCRGTRGYVLKFQQCQEKLRSMKSKELILY